MSEPTYRLHGVPGSPPIRPGDVVAFPLPDGSERKLRVAAIVDHADGGWTATLEEV